MQIGVEGPGTVKFQWKVSSESGYDYLEFWVDGIQRDAISGITDWAEKTFTVTGAGPHTLKWGYAKDGSESIGEDCGWLDGVQWAGSDPWDNWTTLLYRAACPERSERDADGRRVEKLYNYATITKYVYDGDHCIAEYDGSSNLQRKYIYGPGVDEPVCMIEAAGSYMGTYYYHFDASGNVVALTSGNVDHMGETVQVYDYDVYGRVGATDASHPNRFMFTGREFDKETGLYYYRARYYNAEIGRFLQTDPVGYDAGMNFYRYCNNNPWNRVDPTGHQAEDVGPPYDSTRDGGVDEDPNKTSCWAGEPLTQIYYVGARHAWKARACAVDANSRAAELTDLRGGPDSPRNAFLHCYWSCCMAKEIGPNDAETVGDIHERCKPDEDPRSTDMDKYNNAMGRAYGASDSNCAFECYRAAKKKEENGGLRVLK
jgi:RHS repeat-associated protein